MKRRSQGVCWGSSVGIVESRLQHWGTVTLYLGCTLEGPQLP